MQQPQNRCADKLKFIARFSGFGDVKCLVYHFRCDCVCNSCEWLLQCMNCRFVGQCEMEHIVECCENHCVVAIFFLWYFLLFCFFRCTPSFTLSGSPSLSFSLSRSCILVAFSGLFLFLIYVRRYFTLTKPNTNFLNYNSFILYEALVQCIFAHIETG